MTNTIALPARDELRFALLGAGFHLCTLAELLVQNGFPKPLIITYPRAEHRRDQILLTDSRIYRSVFEVADELGLDVIDQTADDADLITQIENAGCQAVFSLSWRQRITRTFIDAFKGQVFNIHPSLLPKERGSGTFSYRIMNDLREASATIHLVDKGIDTGDVIMQASGAVEVSHPVPRDYLIATNAIYRDLLGRFVDHCAAGTAFSASAQEQDAHTYLPLLHTETNGAIDWSWNAALIERFIRAFAAPYPGAFTFLGEQRLVIREADLEQSEIDYHPYLNGRVVSIKTNGEAQIVANGGLLRLKSVSVDGQTIAPREIFRATSCLHTPVSVLERARTTVLRANQMNIPDSPGSQ